MQPTKEQRSRNLSLLTTLMQHYTAYSLSTPPGRDVFTTRATVGCAIFYLYDAVLRQRTPGDNDMSYKYQEDEICDIPMSLLITGQVGVPMMMPVYACGLHSSKGPVRDLGEATSTSLLTDPRVAAKRSQCMEYSRAQRDVLGSEAHELFRFNGETCIKDCTFLFMYPGHGPDFEGTIAFLMAVSSNLGIGDTDMPPVIRDGSVEGLEDTPVEALTVMERMCGWFADLGKAIPELKQCRDMAVWARLLMEPSQAQNGLSSRLYTPADAEMEWQFTQTDATFNSNSKGDLCYFKVKAFGMQLVLGCDPPASEDSPLVKHLTIDTADGRGTRAMTEMDIVQAQHLDSFDSNLSQEDSQTFHCALCAPSLRIPLLLDFFSQNRAGALFSSKLAQLAESAICEPGFWSLPGAPLNFTEVPSRDPVSTSHGLLWSEAKHSPQLLLSTMATMLQDAIAISVGGHDSAYVGVLLFVLRLVVTAKRFLKLAAPQSTIFTQQMQSVSHSLMQDLLPVLDRWRAEAEEVQSWHCALVLLLCA